MCGIAGISRSKKDSAAALMRALSKMEKRGPDEIGHFSDDIILLGHQRLKIMDLISGQQPMKSADGRYVIVFNGEIYNFQQLRAELSASGTSFSSRCDTEVILKLFEHFGLDCFERLQGMFAFAIYDALREKIFLVRDRLGVKPLCYGISERGLIFASTVRAALELDPQLKSDIDYRALSQFLSYGSVGDPDTPFEGLKKVKAGTCVTIDLKTMRRSENRFWMPELLHQVSGNEIELAIELNELVHDAVSCRMNADRPLGLLLSGGVDSAIVAACMADKFGENLKAFTVGFPSLIHDEADDAKQLATFLGIDNQRIFLDESFSDGAYIESLWESIGEPMADASLVPTALIAKQVSSALTVSLTGDGPDELWGGYPRHRHALKWASLKSPFLRHIWLCGRKAETAFSRLRGKQKEFPQTPLDRIIQRELPVELLTQRLTSDVKELMVRHSQILGYPEYELIPEYVNPNPEWDTFTAYSFFECQTYLRNQVLAKVDSASMFHSVEARSPFLDYRLVEWALKLPYQMKIHPKHGSKYLLKRAFESHVPKGYFEKPKRYFSPPLGIWLRDGLSEWVKHHLCGHYGQILFDQKYVKSVLSEHERSVNKQSEIWSAVALAHWCESNSILLN